MEVTEDVSHSTISGIGKYTGEIWGVYMEVPRPNIGRLYGSHKVDQKKGPQIAGSMEANGLTAPNFPC